MAEDFISGALAGQQFQLNQFLIQEAPIKLEQQKMALAVTSADFEKRQKMAELLAAKPPKQGDNPLENALNTLTGMSSAAVESGLPEEAAKYLKDVGVISEQMQDAAYKRWQEESQKNKMATQLLSGVHSQEDLDNMNRYIAATQGKPSFLEGAKYSPEFIRSIQDGLAKHLDETTAAWRRAQTETEVAKAAAERELVPLRKSQEELNRAREKNAGKVGGKDGGGLEASAKHVRSMSEYITTKRDGIDKNLADSVAQEVALDAEHRMRTEGKTWPQAMHDAYLHSMTKGKLAGIRVTKDRPGTTWDKPAPIPDSPDKLQQDMIYNVQGTPARWDAVTKQFYPEGQGPEETEDETEDDD